MQRVDAGTFGAGKHDGADQARLLTLRPSCSPDGVNCWLPNGEFEPTPF